MLFQAYFVAFLVCGTWERHCNPGNPYVGSTKQNGFGTFGGPDFAATIRQSPVPPSIASGIKSGGLHLRHRPESGGAIVRQILTGNGNTLMGHVNDNVLNSQAVQESFNKFGDYFLRQAFPEGSPTHPAYPTGHGTVAGACITALKFFFDGNFVIPNPVVPTPGGLSLVPYTGSDAGQITVNGELNKLAHNVSFGHGIHAGIHWRSDTDFLHPTRRGSRDQHPAGSGANLCGTVHRKPDEDRRHDRDHLQSIAPPSRRSGGRAVLRSLLPAQAC